MIRREPGIRSPCIIASTGVLKVGVSSCSPLLHLAVPLLPSPFAELCAKKVQVTLIEKGRFLKNPRLLTSHQKHLNAFLPNTASSRSRSSASVIAESPLCYRYRILILSLRFQMRGCRRLGDHSRDHRPPRQPASAETRREELRVERDHPIASSPGPASSFRSASSACYKTISDNFSFPPMIMKIALLDRGRSQDPKTALLK